MDDALLSYYNRELTYIRKLGAEFAEQHPKIAGRLRLDEDTIEDPHVSRLIESFAFLTARIRHTIDDSFPELTEALMGTLYPNYHAPFPSQSVVQINNIPEVPSPQTVRAGRLLYVEGSGDARCQYQTCRDVEVLPLLIDGVKFSSMPVKAPSIDVLAAQQNPQAILKVSLSDLDGASRSDWDTERLTFYIDAQPQVAHKLFEFMMNHCLGVAVADPLQEAEPVLLPASAISSAGFIDTENSFFEGRNANVFRQLSEYFVCPETALFINVDGVEEIWQRFDGNFEIYFYFDATHPELVQAIDRNSIRLGCVPIINLFSQTTESIQAKDVGHEVRLRLPAHVSEFADIYSIQSVCARNNKGEKIDLSPFYGSHLQDSDQARGVYWYARRENSHFQHGSVSYGTDTYLSLVDEKFRVIDSDDDWLITAEVVCTNRDMPSKLPFGPGQPLVRFDEGGAGLRARCLTAPTVTIQPKLGELSRWQLVSQLSLQSFAGPEGLSTLKQALELHDLVQSRESRSVIDALRDLSTKPITSRISQDGRSGICQGTEITLTLDQNKFSGFGIYIFGQVLDQFMAHFCAVNSFIKLKIKLSHRPGVYLEWPPRVGNQTLL
ncbi:type VI secretion system baseplate subunit TssF [Aurantivibrio plasticivorans]